MQPIGCRRRATAASHQRSSVAHRVGKTPAVRAIIGSRD